MSGSGDTDPDFQLTRPDWLDRFEQVNGRPLRVLHLGNIANNGFQNAKIMRRAGIAADCVAYDYYHVMGTAEWEDSAFSGNIGDSFYPDWWRVRLKGYRRPDWFIQGPKTECIAYLHAHNHAMPARPLLSDSIDRTHIPMRPKAETWEDLELATYLHTLRHSDHNSRGGSLRHRLRRLRRRIAFRWFLLLYYLRHPALTRRRFSTQWNAFVRVLSIAGAVISFPIILFVMALQRISEGLLKLIPPASRAKRREWLERRRAHRRMRIILAKRSILPFTMAVAGFAAQMVRRLTGKRFGELFGDGLANRLTIAIGVRSATPFEITKDMDIDEIQRRRAARKRRREERRREAREAESPDQADDLMQEEIDKVLDEEELAEESRSYLEVLVSACHFYLDLANPNIDWVRSHTENFASVGPEELRKDIIIARVLAKEWEGVMEYYDAVIGYSTDGILAMQASRAPFFCYEHGTLRAIPFENTTIGRLCATSYRTCEGLMLTNLDLIDKPQQLGMRPGQIVHLPHAVDDAKLLGFRKAHAKIQPTRHDAPLLFHPARHDWSDPDPSLTKGNDKLLRAVKALVDEGFNMRLLLLDWGRDVGRSKELIGKLGIGHVCEWMSPMQKSELWKTYFRAHAVLDQFALPAFGGITFEALTFSKRVVSWVNMEQAGRFFGEEPPILTCSTPTTIANALRLILLDPEDRMGLGQASGEWAAKYHSSQYILDKQLEAFRPVLTAPEERDAGTRSVFHVTDLTADAAPAQLEPTH